MAAQRPDPLVRSRVMAALVQSTRGLRLVLPSQGPSVAT